MEIKDLRIGNWIMWDKRPFEVYKETFFDIENAAKPFMPIPLNGEWFDKLGFHNLSIQGVHGWTGKRELLLIDGLKLIVSDFAKLVDGELVYPVKVKIGDVAVGRDYVYVHEVQNLFFSLTGHEI